MHDFCVPMAGIIGTAVVVTMLFVLRAPASAVGPPDPDTCTCSCWDGLSEGLTGRVTAEASGRYAADAVGAINMSPRGAALRTTPPPLPGSVAPDNSESGQAAARAARGQPGQYHSVFFNLDGGSFRILLVTLFYAYVLVLGPHALLLGAVLLTAHARTVRVPQLPRAARVGTTSVTAAEWAGKATDGR